MTEVFEERPVYILLENAIKCCNHADREKGGEKGNKKIWYGNLSAMPGELKIDAVSPLVPSATGFAL